MKKSGWKVVAGLAGLHVAFAAGCQGSKANRAPDVALTSVSGAEDQDIAGQVQASDPEGKPLTFSVSRDAIHGTVTLGANGAFTYRPDADVSGTDNFAVTVTDEAGATAIAQVNVTIQPVNDAPVAEPDRVSVTMAATIHIDVLANDRDQEGDALTVSIVEPSLVGTATVAGDNSISITGLPTPFTGFTRLRYRVTDSGGATSEAYAAVFVDMASIGLVTQSTVNGRSQIEITDLVGNTRLVNPGETSTTGVSRTAIARSAGVLAWMHGGSASGLPAKICVTRLSTMTSPVCIGFPETYSAREFLLSSDGAWLALVQEVPDSTGALGRRTLRVFDTTNLSELSWPPVVGAPHVNRLAFAANASHLYFHATDEERPPSSGDGLYRLDLGPSPSIAPVSGPDDPNAPIIRFSISPDETRIVLSRGGATPGVMLVDPAVPGVEHRLSHPMPGTTPVPAFIANDAVTRVAYWVPGAADIYVAEVSATAANPRFFANPGVQAPGVLDMREDGEALLIERWVQTPNSELSYFGTAEVTESVPYRALAGRSPACYAPAGEIWVDEEAFTPYRSIGVSIYDVAGNLHYLGSLAAPRTFIGTCTSGPFAYSESDSVVPHPDPDGIVRFRTAIGNAAAPDQTLELFVRTSAEPRVRLVGLIDY